MPGNQFSGRIPTGIGECSELKALVLNENGFTGEMPTEIGNLMKLGKPEYAKSPPSLFFVYPLAFLYPDHTFTPPPLHLQIFKRSIGNQ